MALDNTSMDWDGAVYGSVGESSTELMLQPYAERSKVMGVAWLGLAGFIILLLPFTILPTLLVMILMLAALSAIPLEGVAIAPQLQNHWLTTGVIFLLWGACFSTIAFLIWKAIADSGYKTFIFDRTQKQLFINTVTVIGRKVVKVIPFSQIKDAQWQESQHQGISISTFLILDDFKMLGLTQPQKIILSCFSSVTSEKTVKTLTAKKHHQELLLSVRDALGFSTQQIANELRQSSEIPTEEELNRQKAQAVAAAGDALKQLAKSVFASKAEKSENFEVLRAKTISFPEDPKGWEKFAIALSLQKGASKDEVSKAYRKAEALYFEQGEIIKAATISQTLKKFR
jgi:hypothetical protein